MRGWVSFHGIDPGLLDDELAPLLVGAKINPERFLDRAVRFRRVGWQSSRFAATLRRILLEAELEETSPAGTLLQRVRAGLDRLSREPDRRLERVREMIDPEVHLEGRPYMITEGSAERVAALVGEYFDAPDADAAEILAREQIARLGPDVARGFAPDRGAELEPDFNYTREVLERLRVLFDLPRAARGGETWRIPDAPPRPATEALRDELAWRVASVHGMVRPFWVGRDVDGLETVCRSAGVRPPDVLVPAYRLVQPVLAEFPDLQSSLGTELSGPRSVGGYVAPGDLPELSSFLAGNGARIIREAARHGEGPRCSVLLKKIRECVAWAESRGFGYLEASGITPVYMELEFDEAAPESP